MLQSALHHRSSTGTLIFFQNRTLQGAAIHTDSDWDSLIFGSIGYRFHAYFTADIAWVDPKLIYPLLDRFQSQTVVKMNIRNNRKMDLLFDFPNRLRSLH